MSIITEKTKVSLSVLILMMTGLAYIIAIESKGSVTEKRVDKLEDSEKQKSEVLIELRNDVKWIKEELQRGKNGRR